MRMFSDIESKKDNVSFVLVFKLSRFGRNVADVLVSLRKMQKYGVNLICVHESDSSKDSGKMQDYEKQIEDFYVRLKILKLR